jgi:hypothetical protein
VDSPPQGAAGRSATANSTGKDATAARFDAGGLQVGAGLRVYF